LKAVFGFLFCEMEIVNVGSQCFCDVPDMACISSLSSLDDHPQIVLSIPPSNLWSKGGHLDHSNYHLRLSFFGLGSQAILLRQWLRSDGKLDGFKGNEGWLGYGVVLC
jgi:hypothetical protein